MVKFIMKAKNISYDKTYECIMNDIFTYRPQFQVFSPCYKYFTVGLEEWID